ncbi:glutamate receptor, ionotropic, delta 2 (Grid2) interacting protein, a [Elysia marginata]|uniref:Glutamate receptor, ionotropic, delta 2 (Grid2) interacting protein, a n=1 Tax=Elysia marginata TaxID=1093978 RepID=A0AAV4JL47_9GAST|nr:glutamate receptor, ionotropic, delta 2 (Grid2) interacting protein, a [Elysia marginata]
MPLRLLHKWPKAFGFEIYGNGPSYVISVQKGSMADKCGLRPGDQLLELNGCDVTAMSQQQIRAVAKPRGFKPPEVKVVSCLQTMEISPELPLGYGFSIAGEKPVVVSSVQYGGSAYSAGLRTGDIILEVTNISNLKLSAMETILSQLPGPITLLVIPVARVSNLVHMDKVLTKERTPNPRLYTARDLYTKLEASLGGDQQTKNLVVNSLKRYAEDRDLGLLCDALKDLVSTSGLPHTIIQKIRLLIPPSQRQRFDAQMLSRPAVPEQLEVKDQERPVYKQHRTTRHHSGQTKLIQIVRDCGSFGFVVKSCSPAIIEAVDIGGPAQSAGLQDGDVLLKLNGLDIRNIGHDRVIELLQESGSAPILEIFRGSPGEKCWTWGCRSDGHQVRNVGPGAVDLWSPDDLARHAESPRSVSSSGSASSLESSHSSHDSTHDILPTNSLTDAQGHTFTQQMSHLLTPAETKIVRDALRLYQTRRDIVDLFERLSAILDTPSRQSLWRFVLVMLPPVHQEYVTHRVALPDAPLTQSVGGSSQEPEPEVGTEDPGEFPASFQQQLDFLLTATERLQFKQSLKRYHQTQELPQLLQCLESILDSPSKRVLWRLVMPKLTGGHREIVEDNLDLLMHSEGTHPTHGKARTEEASRHDGSSEEDEESVENSSVNSDPGEETEQALALEERKAQPNSESTAKLMEELEQTRLAVMEMRHVIMEQHRKSGKRHVIMEQHRKSGKRHVVTEQHRKTGKRHVITEQHRESGKRHVIMVLHQKSGQRDVIMAQHRKSEHWPARMRGVEEGVETMGGRSSNYITVIPIGQGDEEEEAASVTVDLPPYTPALKQPALGGAVNSSPSSETNLVIQKRSSAPDTTGAANFTMGSNCVQSQTSSSVLNKDVSQVHSMVGSTTVQHGGEQSWHTHDTQTSQHTQHALNAQLQSQNIQHNTPTTHNAQHIKTHSTQHNQPTMQAQQSAVSNNSKLESFVEDTNSTQASKLGHDPVGPGSRPRPREFLPAGPRKPSIGLTKRWPSLALVAGHGRVQETPQVASGVRGGGSSSSQLQERVTSSAATGAGHNHRQLAQPAPPPPPPPPPPLPQTQASVTEQGDMETKKEVLIMDQKKAYNISILLGHLKMSVPEVKQALYQMDEKALPPELIGQLLAFAPSDTETAQYKEYSGDLGQLTKPDQFAQQDLQSIKTAAGELKNSKKLARLLEAIFVAAVVKDDNNNVVVVVDDDDNNDDVDDDNNNDVVDDDNNDVVVYDDNNGVVVNDNNDVVDDDDDNNNDVVFYDDNNDVVVDDDNNSDVVVDDDNNNDVVVVVNDDN